MTYKEAIETIKVAKAEVEWEYPMDYYVAFDLAIEALEDKIEDTVEVGDEVYYHDEIGVVVCVANNYHAISVMSGAGGWMIRTDIKELRKTGNHYPQIKEVLEKMRENDND